MNLQDLQKKTKKNSNGCWVWKQSTSGDRRYGRIRVNGVLLQAHRYAYTLAYGELPEGSVVHHRCSEPLCINPEHLQCTLWNDNLAEMVHRQDLLRRIRKLEKEIERLKKENESKP